MLRHQGFTRCWAVKVACRDGTVFQGLGREQIVGKSVLLDETVHDSPENLGPDFTYSMDTPVPRTVECLVRRGVDSVVLYHGSWHILWGGSEIEHTRE